MFLWFFLDFKFQSEFQDLAQTENNKEREKARERELGHTEILTTNQNQTKLDV